MKQSDLTALREIQQEISTTISEGLNQALSDRLLRLRDGLSFEDADWYHAFTQHVATLDSASTFYPTTDTERRQLDAAIQHAVHQIDCLINVKLG